MDFLRLVDSDVVDLESVIIGELNSLIDDVLSLAISWSAGDLMVSFDVLDSSPGSLSSAREHFESDSLELPECSKPLAPLDIERAAQTLRPRPSGYTSYPPLPAVALYHGLLLTTSSTLALFN